MTVDDFERWQDTRLVMEQVDVDATMPELNVPSLTLRSCRIPDGELAQLSGLESLVIVGGTAERIDLRGCAQLRHLSVSYVRGLAELVGLDELSALEELDVYAQPRLQTVPSLAPLHALWRLDLGSLKGLTSGLAPFLAAPQLREIQLQSTFPLAPGDAETVRDHPRIVGLSWFDAKGAPAAAIRHLFQTADRRGALMRKEGRPPEHEVPRNRLREIAPEHMVQLSVSWQDHDGATALPSLRGMGDALLDGEYDFGPGLRQIRIILRGGETKPSSTKIKIQQAKGVMTLEHPSAMSGAGAGQSSMGPELFRQVASEAVSALECSRPRVDDQTPEFAIDALIQRCRSASAQTFTSDDDVEALIARAEDGARAMRVAISRLRHTAGKSGNRSR